MADIPRNCPHCGSLLKKWLTPDGTGWSEGFFLVCFNDDCPYYQQGWEWMKQQYNQHVSYRFMVSPTTGVASMVPVWSDAATREMIVEEPHGGGP
jgi:hypothetical protein